MQQVKYCNARGNVAFHLTPYGEVVLDWELVSFKLGDTWLTLRNTVVFRGTFNLFPF